MSGYFVGTTLTGYTDPKTGGSMARRPFISIAVAAFMFAGLLGAQTPGKVDFRRDIRSILEQNRFGCHGPDQQMSGMRLDKRSSAMGIRGGTTIGPGNAEGSRLYLKLISAKYGGRMPPTGPFERGANRFY